MSCGKGYRDLTMIVDARYEFTDSEIVLSDHRVERIGKWLRLGHKNGDEIVYSDGWDVPHQPFEYDGHRYETVRGGKITRDGDGYIGHWDGYAEATNPWVDDDTLWFEARPEGKPAPVSWQVWKMDMKTKEKEFVIEGANPCVYDGKLYYAKWVGDKKTGRFHYAVKD